MDSSSTTSSSGSSSSPSRWATLTRTPASSRTLTLRSRSRSRNRSAGLHCLAVPEASDDDLDEHVRRINGYASAGYVGRWRRDSEAVPVWTVAQQGSWNSRSALVTSANSLHGTPIKTATLRSALRSSINQQRLNYNHGD